MEKLIIDPSEERKFVDFRKMGFGDFLVLGRYHYSYAHESLPEHDHGDVYEIHLVDEGTQTYVVEGRSFQVRGGEVFVTRPGERHGTGPNPESRGRVYFLIVRPPQRGERFLNLPSSEGSELIRRLDTIPSRRFKGRPVLKDYLEHIFRISDNGADHPLRDAELKNWMLRFLLEMLEDAWRSMEKAVTSPIARVMQYVEDHVFAEMPSVEQLAELVNLSESRFKTRFKDETGVSPGNYILMRKIAKAKEQLVGTDMSVTDIGIGLGFSSSQYFATVFKRYTRITPTQFRRGVKMGDG